MPHVEVFRTGWTNERFAELALSHICFISRPATIADDIGSDLQCTLFERIDYAKGSWLVPRSPFIVQVKSSGNRISLTKHKDYLARLEAPFFIGVPDKERLRLQLYSGRYLPFAFAYRGDQPRSLTAVLTPRRKPSKKALDESVSGRRTQVAVSFPRVTSLDLRPSREKSLANARLLESECLEIGLNNYLRLTGQYVFSFGSGKIRRVLAGEGSVQVFRKNFSDRLTEYCMNMAWLLKNRPKSTSKVEAAEILAVVDLMAHRLPKNDKLTQAVRLLRERMGKGAAEQANEAVERWGNSRFVRMVNSQVSRNRMRL